MVMTKECKGYISWLGQVDRDFGREDPPLDLPESGWEGKDPPSTAR